MSYTPTNSDATAVATDTIARLNTSPSPNAGASLKDATVALLDSILCAVGFQLESNNALAAHTYATNSYADIPGTSITFTAPIAKTYVVHCDFSAYFQSLGSGTVRLVVNGSNGAGIWIDQSVANNYHTPIHLMHAAACAAGSNTIKLQWLTNAGATIAITTTDYANYLIHG